MSAEDNYAETITEIEQNIEDIKNHLVDDNMVVKKDTDRLTVKNLELRENLWTYLLIILSRIKNGFFSGLGIFVIGGIISLIKILINHHKKATQKSMKQINKDNSFWDTNRNSKITIIEEITNMTNESFEIIQENKLGS